MTALDDAVDILAVRHAGIVAAFADAFDAAQQAAVATDALTRLGLDPDALTLDGAHVPSVRLALDVTVWTWVEWGAALLYDFSADGGSYQRSQLAASAARMRRRAEDAAMLAGLDGFGWPPVEVGVLVWREATGDESERV